MKSYLKLAALVAAFSACATNSGAAERATFRAGPESPPRLGHVAAGDLPGYQRKAQQHFNTTTIVTVRWYNGPCEPSLDGETDGELGWAPLNSTVINLNRRCWGLPFHTYGGHLREAWRCTLFLHEYGHAVLGLQHTRTGLMAPQLAWPARPCR